MKTLLEAVHEAVLCVQSKTHGPKYLSVVLAQVVEGLHQLVQVRVGVDDVRRQDVVKPMRGARETPSHLLTPDQLSDLQADVSEADL